MPWVAYVLAGLSIAVMGADVVLAVRLHRAIVGGEIGQRWGVLTALLILSFLGCLLTPLALWLQVPAEWLNLLTLGVVLIGAVFVFVAIGIIRDALGFLKLSR
jgi:hypothetical protein